MTIFSQYYKTENNKNEQPVDCDEIVKLLEKKEDNVTSTGSNLTTTDSESMNDNNSLFTTAATMSFIGQLSSIQDQFFTQFQDLSGALPEVGGPLNAAFRTRIMNATYLIGGSVAFAILAIVIGLPTIIIRPAKFVICMTLSTLFAIASIAVLQKPSVFINKLLTGNTANNVPFILLVFSLLLTFYVTIFIHRYVFTIACGGMQLLAMFFYLSAYIPGGSKGLQMLLKTAYTVLLTISKPFIFVCCKTIQSIFNRMFES